MKKIALPQLRQLGGGYYFAGGKLPDGRPVDPRARVLLVR